MNIENSPLTNINIRASLVAQRVKSLPATRETRVRSLGWEDPLEKEIATHSSTFAWKIQWTEKPGRLQSMGLQRIGHDWGTFTSLLTNIGCSVQFISVTQSCPTLQPHGLQHTRPPCLSPTPGVYSNLCPLSQWCHPTISSSIIPFSSHLQSFPASGSFQKSQLFIPGGQSIGVSALTSDLPMNIQDWFLLGWTGWISLRSKGLSRLLQHHSSKASILRHSAFFTVYRLYPSSNLAASYLCRFHASCSHQLFATVMETVFQ